MALAASDIDILVQQGEGTTLEFKESLSASFARELVGLANTTGGRILLGVSDDGVVKGIKDTNALRARVQDIARNCDPPVKVLVKPVGDVLAVEVRESDAKPVQCSDGFFWRQGAVTQKMSREEIRDFFRAEGVIRFDLAPCPRFNYPEDFDREKFDAWLRLSGISAGHSVEDVLVNIEVAERTGDRLLFRNAGVLFFAKNVRRFFRDAYITCLLGRGTDKVHILDRKDFDGGIVADIEETMRFIERNTRLAYRIEGLRRQNIPEYLDGGRARGDHQRSHAPRLVLRRRQCLRRGVRRPNRGDQPRRPAKGHVRGRSRPQDGAPKHAGRRPAPPHRLHREGRHGHPPHS